MSSHTGSVTTTEHEVALDQLYADFAAHSLMPLWTVRGDLMPHSPSPRAVPQVWRWADVLPIAERAGQLVPVGRGGERRAIAYANDGLKPEPYATPTLWAAAAVPRPEGGRARASPFAERVPLRPRRRGRLDSRRW